MTARMTPAEQVAFLNRVNGLEAAGRHQEAVELCESAIDGTESPEIHLALARNAFALAAGGNETYAWPALLAALEAIEKWHGGQSEIAHAVGVCRWVLDLFADPCRLDARGFAERSAARSPVNVWWAAGAAPPAADGAGPPLPDAGELAAMHARGDHVRLCNALLAAAPVQIRHGRASGWVGREASYLMAMLHTSVAGEEVAGLLSEGDFPLPGDYEAQPYDRYLLTAARVRRQRLQARGVASVLVCALPKSASEFLSYTLSEVLGAVVVRVTIGDPLLGTVYAPWAATAALGGCVLHDHFAASEVNLAALRAAGVGRLAVLVRDPRAVFWSLAVMESEYDGAPPAARLDGPGICARVKLLADWIDSWVRARAAGFPVEFIRFRELTADPEAVMGNLLDASGAGAFRPRLREVLRERAERSRVSSNFRRGDDNAWRSHISPDLHPAIWGIIPVGVRELLDLEP